MFHGFPSATTSNFLEDDVCDSVEQFCYYVSGVPEPARSYDLFGMVLNYGVYERVWYEMTSKLEQDHWVKCLDNCTIEKDV